MMAAPRPLTTSTVPPTHLQRVGQTVTRRRVDLRLSQLALATLAGTTQQTISRIEAGTQRASDELRVQVAKALQVDVIDLFPYPTEED